VSRTMPIVLVLDGRRLAAVDLEVDRRRDGE
jgi:hypothetical protein